MSSPQGEKVTLEEFYRRREETKNLLEYLDGSVLMSPSPSTQYQRISGKLQAKLFNFLEGSDCEVFSAPYDIQLYQDGLKGDRIFIPDLSVICDKEGTEENKYVGVPSLIVEIFSLSNQSHDLVLKMNMYMQYGVKEYWIVNPMLNVVQLYVIDDGGSYQQKDIIKETGFIESKEFPGFVVHSEDIF